MEQLIYQTIYVWQYNGTDQGVCVVDEQHRREQYFARSLPQEQALGYIKAAIDHCFNHISTTRLLNDKPPERVVAGILKGSKMETRSFESLVDELSKTYGKKPILE